MYEKIRKYLYEKAPHLAVQAFEAMSDAKRLTLLMAEERSYSISIIKHVILEIANTMVSGDPSRLISHARLFAQQRSQKGIPLDFGLERIRLVRDQMVAACRNYAAEWLDSEEHQLVLMQMELMIYRYVDTYVETYTNSYVKAQEMSEKGRSKLQVSGSFRITDEAERAIVDMIFYSNDIGLLLLDRELKICDANQALADILKMDKNEMIGSSLEDLFGQRPEQRFFVWAVERGVSGHYVANYHGKWITFTIRPLYLDEERWGAIAVFRSVTQSKQFEEELTKRDALASIGQLAAGIVHEIRNPLTSVKGFIQLLRERVVSDQSSMYFSVIHAEIERMEGLINDVLVLAGFRDDKLAPEPFCFRDEVEGVLRLLEPEANRRGIQLTSDVETEEGKMIGLRHRIKQVILNLCKNALEAVTGNGSRVHIQLVRQENQLVLSVEDDGPGLSAEAKQHLFMPFYTTKQEGTGLGLSMTKQIVEDHRGSIQVTTSPTLSGARFTVRFPITEQDGMKENVADL